MDMALALVDGDYGSVRAFPARVGEANAHDDALFDGSENSRAHSVVMVRRISREIAHVFRREFSAAGCHRSDDAIGIDYPLVRSVFGDLCSALISQPPPLVVID